jgi:hypothetical protein
VPEVSRFFGIVIGMFYNDHAPPHFHAVYGDHEATIRIDQVGLLEGKLPARALSMVIEWAVIHQEELRQNWNRLRDKQPLTKIAPLQ